MAVGKLFGRSLLATALLGFVVMAPGTPRARAATVTTPDISTIPSQVRHQLNMLPWYGVFDYLGYQVNGTEVTLTGQVTSEHAVTKDDFETFVKSIPGVTKVINKIEVLPPSPFDSQIRRAEYHRIFSTSDLGGYSTGVIPPLHIIVKNGHVTLEGQVMDQMDKNLAGIAANSVPGVFSVQNNLQVKG